MAFPFRLAGLTAALLVVATPAAAQHRPVTQAKPRVAHHRARVVFRTNDRAIFRNYYRNHHLVVTRLRPEVALLVVIGKPLPASVVRTPLPHDLVVLLEPPPTGYEYLLVGNRVVILDDEHNVSDVLLDVIEVP